MKLVTMMFFMVAFGIISSAQALPMVKIVHVGWMGPSIVGTFTPGERYCIAVRHPETVVGCPACLIN